jgi:hypothetical protein
MVKGKREKRERKEREKNSPALVFNAGTSLILSTIDTGLQALRSISGITMCREASIAMVGGGRAVVVGGTFSEG